MQWAEWVVPGQSMDQIWSVGPNPLQKAWKLRRGGGESVSCHSSTAVSAHPLGIIELKHAYRRAPQPHGVTGVWYFPYFVLRTGYCVEINVIFMGLCDRLRERAWPCSLVAGSLSWKRFWPLLPGLCMPFIEYRKKELKKYRNNPYSRAST